MFGDFALPCAEAKNTTLGGPKHNCFIESAGFLADFASIMRSDYFSNTPIACTNTIRIILSKWPYYKLEGTLKMESSSSWINHLGGNWRVFVTPRVTQWQQHWETRVSCPVIQSEQLLSSVLASADHILQGDWPQMNKQGTMMGAELYGCQRKDDTLEEIILTSLYRSPSCELNVPKLHPPFPLKKNETSKQT